MLLAIHPSASCPSRIWPVERFSAVADWLVEHYNCRVVIVAAAQNSDNAGLVARNMRHPALNLAGMTNIAQLASLLKRCRLVISNDSGPVHIASAVGTPVIVIFGRKQKGLSPLRWGPVGRHDRIIHKDVGCIQCLAHNCTKEFACLKAISVDDVTAIADKILKNRESEAL